VVIAQITNRKRLVFIARNLTENAKSECWNPSQ
jgi:hypothetical protein